MKSEDILDHVGSFHDYGLYIPTRTIKLESSLEESDGEELGVSYSMSTKFLKNLSILESMGSSPINIILSTTGGNVWEGMAIYDAIKAAKSHITIRVYGVAMSMGSILLQAANERVLSPHAIVMFHAGIAGVPPMSPQEARNYGEFDFKFGKIADKILLDRINEKREQDNQALMSKHAFESACMKGTYLLAEEAIAWGLADRIEL